MELTEQERRVLLDLARAAVASAVAAGPPPKPPADAGGTP
jgi:hypothetical protein